MLQGRARSQCYAPLRVAALRFKDREYSNDQEENSHRREERNHINCLINGFEERAAVQTR